MGFRLVPKLMTLNSVMTVVSFYWSW